MSEYLEFKDEEMPKRNPNIRNDIYHFSRTKGADGIFIIGIGIALFVIAVGVYYGGSTFIICTPLGVLFLIFFMMFIYDKYFFRKKVVKHGRTYPAIIVRAFEYEKQMGAIHGKRMSFTEYGLVVKYEKGEKEFMGYDGKPENYLENPYCTVYEWNNRTMVADFKVRDKYITKDGKSYSLKPIKKENS